MDPKGYYKTLNIAPSATLDDVKAAYKKRAKELHPDINKNKDSTAEFQKLQEAYSALSDPVRRKNYDNNIPEPVNETKSSAQAPVECDCCGCVTAQPRFVYYARVIAIIYASFRNDYFGVFCARCACKKLFWNSLITGACGWLGLHGFFWSIRALAINIQGGLKNQTINASILRQQAFYFWREGDEITARCIAQDAIKYCKKPFPIKSGLAKHYDDATVRNEVKAHCENLLRQCRVKNNIAIKNVWWKPVAASAFGFIIPCIAWIVLLNHK